MAETPPLPPDLKDRGWAQLLLMADNSDDNARQLAVIKGFSWLEHALVAAGLKTEREPTAPVLYRAYEDGVLDASVFGDKWLPELIRTLVPTSKRKIRRLVKNFVAIYLQPVIDTRHRATHHDEIPSGYACTKALTLYHGIWKSLQSHTVNSKVACEIAHKLSKLPGITEVCLFGSLARQERCPRDIDLLVCDDGRYSVFGEPLYHDSASRTAHFLKQTQLEDANLAAMVQSRWLDIFPIAMHLFGSETDYTLALRDKQPDPFFLKNISVDLQRYDPPTNRFEPGSNKTSGRLCAAYASWSPKTCSQTQ